MLRTSSALLSRAISWVRWLWGQKTRLYIPGVVCVPAEPRVGPLRGGFKSSGDSWCYRGAHLCVEHDVTFLLWLLQFSRIITEHLQIPSVSHLLRRILNTLHPALMWDEPSELVLSLKSKDRERHGHMKSGGKWWEVELFQLVEPGLRAKLCQCLSGWERPKRL